MTSRACGKADDGDLPQGDDWKGEWCGGRDEVLGMRMPHILTVI